MPKMHYYSWFLIYLFGISDQESFTEHEVLLSVSQVFICWHGHQSGVLLPLAEHPELHLLGVIFPLLSWKITWSRSKGAGQAILYKVYFYTIRFYNQYLLYSTKWNRAISCRENLRLPFAKMHDNSNGWLGASLYFWQWVPNGVIISQLGPIISLLRWMAFCRVF